MRKSVVLIIAVAFLATFSISSVSADTVVPGAYGQYDNSAAGGNYTSGTAWKSQMQIGARDRALTAAENIKSGALRSLSNAGNGGGADWQFGQSQTEQSWKAAKTVEEAQVRGLVAGDCGGDNTTDAYRRQMNQNRKGFKSEPVISNAQCGAYHATLK